MAMLFPRPLVFLICSFITNAPAFGPSALSSRTYTARRIASLSSSFAPFSIGPSRCQLSQLSQLSLQAPAADRDGEDVEETDKPYIQEDDLLDALDSWLRTQSLELVLPRPELESLLEDIRADTDFWRQQRIQFSRLWRSFEVRLRKEERPLRELIGETTSDRALNLAEELEVDPQLIQAALRTEEAEGLMGFVLYEGIFEFIQSVDILGNVFNQLPILGPMRQALITASKSQMDATLGPQIKKFIGSYTRKAVEEAGNFVVAEVDLGRTSRKGVQYLLDRPISALLPDPLEMGIIRDNIWSALREFKIPNEEELLTSLYDEFGDEEFSILLPSQKSERTAKSFNSARHILSSNLKRFFVSSEWQQWMARYGSGGSAGEVPLADGLPAE